MSENEKPAEVFIQKEGRILRWGEGAYFYTWNGLKKNISHEALRMVAIPVALLIGAVTYFFSGRKELSDTRSKTIDVPTVSSTAVPIVSKILTEETKTSESKINQLPKDKAKPSALGRIQVLNLRENSEIPMGTMAEAVLESGATNGIVKAKLTRPLIVDDEAILPEGSTVFGRGKSSAERLYIEFRRAILPTGEILAIRAQALDGTDQILGLKGEAITQKTKKMGLAMGLGALGGMADALQDSSGSSIWTAPKRKSARDVGLAGFSKATLDQSAEMMEEAKSAPVIIEVKKGSRFLLMIDEPNLKEVPGGE